MKEYITTKIKRSEDLVVELPSGWANEGEKVSIHDEDGKIIISKMCEIELDLEDDVFIKIAKEAHEKDITFNEMVSELLLEYVNQHKSDSGENFSNESVL